MALRAVLMYIKDKHLSAKRGKQWGKHYPHLAAFLCTGLNVDYSEMLMDKAFGRISKIFKQLKLDPSGPLLLEHSLQKPLKMQVLSGFFF